MKTRHSKFSVQRSVFSVRRDRIHPSSLPASGGQVLHPSQRSPALARRSLGGGGFTLIELMVVIVIITIIASIAISTAKYAETKAAHSRTVAEMASMETALESYKNDSGIYPSGDNTFTSSIAIYQAITVGPKTYMPFKPKQLQTNTTWNSNLIMDPFGRPYYYQYPGVSNVAGFDLWSAGPDAQTNTVDDIVNWRPQ